MHVFGVDHCGLYKPVCVEREVLPRADWFSVTQQTLVACSSSPRAGGCRISHINTGKSVSNQTGVVIVPVLLLVTILLRLYRHGVSVICGRHSYSRYSGHKTLRIFQFSFTVFPSTGCRACVVDVAKGVVHPGSVLTSWGWLWEWVSRVLGPSICHKCG